MEQISDYIAMGGYAVFVWPSYLLSATVLIWLVISSIYRLRVDRRNLEALKQRNPRHSPKDMESASDP